MAFKAQQSKEKKKYLKAKSWKNEKENLKCEKSSRKIMKIS